MIRAVGRLAGRPTGARRVQQVFNIQPADLELDLDLGRESWKREKCCSSSSSTIGRPIRAATSGRWLEGELGEPLNRPLAPLGCIFISTPVRLGQLPNFRPLNFRRENNRNSAGPLVAPSLPARAAGGKSGSQDLVCIARRGHLLRARLGGESAGRARNWPIQLEGQPPVVVVVVVVGCCCRRCNRFN